MKSPLKEKSFEFAKEVVKLTQFLVAEKKEYILSKQILKSGTAIGALISESEFAVSKPDFTNKLSIALKEANETHYWLMLLFSTEYIDKETYSKLESHCKELITMLVSSVKTSKN